METAGSTPVCLLSSRHSPLSVCVSAFLVSMITMAVAHTREWMFPLLLWAQRSKSIRPQCILELSKTLTGLPRGNIPISNTTDLKVMKANAQSLRMVIGPHPTSTPWFLDCRFLLLGTWHLMIVVGSKYTMSWGRVLLPHLRSSQLVL